MKKLLTAGVALLSVATLAACSGKTASESSSKDAKASSSKVEKSSTSESKSSSSSKSSKSATSSVKIPEIVLLTDDEIDNAKTIGDFKNLYTKLIDNYKKYAQDIGQKMPASQRDSYNQQVEPAMKAMDESKTQFDTMLSSAGSDDTVVPDQGRTPFLQQIKTSRDSLKKILDSVYTALGSYTSSSAE